MGGLTRVLRGEPNPKQREFFESGKKYVAYGGARGGGKSWALRRKLTLMCVKHSGLSCLLIRRTYAELRENHIRPLQSELSGIASYHDTHKTFTFSNGSRIKLGYLDSESDVLRYQGQEYDVIALDEATQLTEYQFQTLKACLRGTNGLPKRMYITCNPGGVGHGWVKRLFIDRAYRAGEDASEYAFIQALVYDNKALLESNPDYERQLLSLPFELRQAWLYGRWDVFSGQYFPEFDADIHTVEPAEIPSEGLSRYAALDYGLDMLAVVFVGVDSCGCAYVYDEIHEKNMIVSEAAKLILAKSGGVTSFIAPSDLWSRQKDSGKSISDLFSESGVQLTKLVSTRVDGWMALKEWLKPVPVVPSGGGEENGMTSALKISRSCTHLIDCLPRLLFDARSPNDCSTSPHDITHITDALRYFAAARIVTPFREKTEAYRKLISTRVKRLL